MIMRHSVHLDPTHIALANKVEPYDYFYNPNILQTLFWSVVV